MTSLRIVTWNIHKGRGADLRVSIERTAELLIELDADVVLLQEVFRESERHGGFDQARYLAAALDMPHAVSCWNVPRRRGIYGNTTLSRLPLARHENVDLRWRDRKARSALYAEAATGAGSVHLLNCHLGLSHVERLHQMRRLVRRTEQLVGESEPVVIAGDTNDWRDALHADSLEAAGYRCSTSAGRSGGPLPTFPSVLPVGGLDRVFWRGDATVSLASTELGARARVASDHLPVVVEMELPRTS